MKCYCCVCMLFTRPVTSSVTSLMQGEGKGYEWKAVKQWHDDSDVVSSNAYSSITDFYFNFQVVSCNYNPEPQRQKLVDNDNYN